MDLNILDLHSQRLSREHRIYFDAFDYQAPLVCSRHLLNTCVCQVCTDWEAGGCGVGDPALESWLHCMLFARLLFARASYLILLDACFIVCKMGDNVEHYVNARYYNEKTGCVCTDIFARASLKAQKGKLEIIEMQN